MYAKRGDVTALNWIYLHFVNQNPLKILIIKATRSTNFSNLFFD